jgi:CubicO group peptidase (beta-lactamase class C family)
MAIIGYNWYVDGVQVNDAPVTATYTIPGLASNTDYTITARAVDAAGNEGELSDPKVFETSAVAVPVEGPMSAADAAAIDAIVAAYKVADNPSVMVSVTGPKGYYSKAYGYADRDTKAPQHLDNHFRIASVTKTFTARAILLQVDAGELSLDDTVGQYVTDITNGDTITIKQLLMHTSGVYEYLADLGVLATIGLAPTSAFSEEAALNVIRNKPATFAPGEKYQYMNSNYVLLGAVLHAITGRPVNQVITEDILVPLGLTETSWPDGVNLPAPASKGYSPPLVLFFGGGEMTAFNPWLAGAAGALVSTMGDLVKWAHELRVGTQLSTNMQELWRETQMAVPNPYEGPETAGYGFGALSIGSWMGHDGGINGFKDVVMTNMDNGAVIVVMQNWSSSNPPQGNLFVRIAEHLYPETLVQRDYTVLTLRPAAASVEVAEGTPLALVESVDKVCTPASAVVSINGGTPGGVDFRPVPASLSVSGGEPTVVNFTPFVTFTEENLTRVNRTTPAGTSGCWVTLIGAGGGGGSGRRSTFVSNRYGGGGGGGGSVIQRTFIPAASLGPTYTVTPGLKGAGGDSSGLPGVMTDGNAGGNGGASVFVSGSVSWSAGGGFGGGAGTDSSSSGGAGGTVSASGYTPSGTVNGTAGGASVISATAGAGVDNNSQGPAGGGAGGSVNSVTYFSGGDGGDVVGVSVGGAGAPRKTTIIGADGPPPVAGVAGSGAGGGQGTRSSTGGAAGGRGIGYGAGGGGGGAKDDNAINNAGGQGGPGYTKIEWV